MITRPWWERPQLRTDEDEHRERRVSWLDLFYDLVFVVVIAELSHSLSEHITPDGVLGFVLLFIPVWWCWIGNTVYNERFETNDLSSRAFTFLQMLPIAALAVFAHDGLGETSVPFALSYIAVRIVLIGLWLRGGWYEPRIRPVTNRYAIGFTASVLLFITSVFVPPPWRFALWGLGLLIDLVTPITTLALQRNLPRYSSSKLPERFGLFVIVVLGEGVVGVVQGVAENEELSLRVGAAGALGMALAFGLWWIYFDYIGRRRPKPGAWLSIGWNYLHLPLLMGIVATGAGVLNVVAGSGAGLSDQVRALIAGAIAVSLFSLGALEVTLGRDADEPTHPRLSPALKFAAAGLAAGLALWGNGLGPIALLSNLLLLVLVQMAYGAFIWFRQPIASVARPIEP